MTKQDFLDKLRVALSGRVSPGLVTENLNYYEEYINTEVRKGKSERDVLAALGDPRLIARTIVETKGGGFAGDAEKDSGWGNGQKREGREDFGRGFRVPTALWLIVVVLVVILILSTIFSVIATMLPVVLPILLVLLAVKIFRDWIR